MDLEFLDRSPNVTPLLVRLYDTHKLYDLAQDRKPLARTELSDAVCELLAMDLSERESELVADVLIGLLRQAEKDLRSALADRLAVMENVPLRLVLQMANDEIEVASPVLKHSPVLGDLDLIYIIRAKGPAYWQAIAHRALMSEKVMNTLADTKDPNTALALAGNQAVTLTPHTVSVLADVAQDVQDLAAPLLRRREVTDDVAGKFYKHAGRELKKYILDHYEIDPKIMSEAIDDIVSELADVQGKEFTPTESMLNVAESYKNKGLLNVALMLKTLKRGQNQSFVAQFSKFTGLKPETALEILMQSSGQGLAVACKAFGILKPDFVSLYLLNNRMRNQGHTADLGQMTKAVSYYNCIEEHVALDILRNSQD